jgi:uncharacterized phage infection (PIP) family protein YhgE
MQSVEAGPATGKPDHTINQQPKERRKTMPGFNSFSRLVSESQKLLAAVTANAEQLKDAVALRDQMDQVLTDFKALMTRRDTLNADKQVLSKQLTETSQRLNDLSIDLKTRVRAALGSRSEKLVEFQVAPRRKVLKSDRPKSRKAPKTPPAQATGDKPEAKS